MCNWKRLGRFIVLLPTLLTQIVCFSMMIAKLRTYPTLEGVYILVPQFVFDLFGLCLLVFRVCQCCVGNGVCCDEESNTPTWGPGILLGLVGLPLKISFDVLFALYSLNYVTFLVPSTCLSVFLLFITTVLLLYGIGTPRYCMYLCNRYFD